jgi:RNA polymerase sigma factor (sigma-70 family)
METGTFQLTHEHEAFPGFEDAYPLIRRLASIRSRAATRREVVRPADREDLQQELALAAWRSLRHYDSTRAGLKTFLEKVIARRFSSLSRADRSRRPLHSLTEDLQGPNPIPNVEFWADFSRLSAALSELDRRLVAYLLEHSLTEACREFGVTRATIYRRIRNIRAVFENGAFKSTGNLV